jgi:hypothetical protein
MDPNHYKKSPIRLFKNLADGAPNFNKKIVLGPNQSSTNGREYKKIWVKVVYISMKIYNLKKKLFLHTRLG